MTGELLPGASQPAPGSGQAGGTRRDAGGPLGPSPGCGELQHKHSPAAPALRAMPPHPGRPCTGSPTLPARCGGSKGAETPLSLSRGQDPLGPGVRQRPAKLMPWDEEQLLTAGSFVPRAQGHASTAASGCWPCHHAGFGQHRQNHHPVLHQDWQGDPNQDQRGDEAARQEGDLHPVGQRGASPAPCGTAGRAQRAGRTTASRRVCAGPAEDSAEQRELLGFVTARCIAFEAINGL